MERTASRKHRHNHYDLYSDFGKIKEALSDAGYDVTGKAGQILQQSLDGIYDTSTDLKDSVAEYAAKKPFKSLGLVLLTGIAIGFLMRKK